MAVDALASRSLKRLCRTVQLSDTGIAPGSGVGNHRAALDRALPGGAGAGGWGPHGGGRGHPGPPICWGRAELPPLGEGRDLLVTPKDIDSQVSDMAKVIGYGIGAWPSIRGCGWRIWICSSAEGRASCPCGWR